MIPVSIYILKSNGNLRKNYWYNIVFIGEKKMKKKKKMNYTAKMKLWQTSNGAISAQISNIMVCN